MIGDYAEAMERLREREWEERCNQEENEDEDEENWMEEFDKWYDEQKDNSVKIGGK